MSSRARALRASNRADFAMNSRVVRGDQAGSDSYFFSIAPGKILICWKLRRASLRLSPQILAYKEVIRKIFRDKELAKFAWKNAGVTIVPEFGYMKRFCSFGFRLVKVVRHNDSDRSCGKRARGQTAGRQYESDIYIFFKGPEGLPATLSTTAELLLSCAHKRQAAPYVRCSE